MTMISLRLPVVVVLAWLAAPGPGAVPVVPYDSLLEDRVSIDGYVDREGREYPGELKNPATGMTVSWGHDDSLIYIALETRGRGWFGIGFANVGTSGATGMDGSNMLVGFDNDDSTELYNMVGKGFGHTIAADGDSLDLDWDIDFDDETGVTILEFAYPLRWSGEGAAAVLADNSVLKTAAIGGLEPGGTYGLILAQNTKSPSLRTKHSHKAKLTFKMADAPKSVPESDSPQRHR